MRKVEVTIEHGPEGDWWVNSAEAVGFFAIGESREEALDNAREALALFLDEEEDSVELVIIEEKEQEGG
jgi:predicted RNase H-like HicB family nuclease